MERILATGVGGGIGQSILKSLQGSSYRLVGMDADHLAAGLHAEIIARLGPRANDPAFVDSVLRICREEECSLVLPGLDAELLLFAENAERFGGGETTVVVSRPEVVRVCDDKHATADFLHQHGFQAPATVSWTDDIDSSWFPLVLKPQRGGARSQHTYVVVDEKQLATVRSLIDPANCVVQEFLDGDEYTCGTVNFDGICHGTIVMRRTLRAGDTYKAFVVRDSKIEEHVRAVAQVLNPFGACNFQLRLKGGEPCIFEINPRCSGTTYARALAGFNEPRMIADYVLHGVAPRYEIREITVLRYWKELVVANDRLAALQEGGRLAGGGQPL